MAKVNPKIDKAVTVLETMCQDKKARAEYLSREMALHDEVTRLEEALEEGRKKGMEEGRKEGLKEGLAKGISQGISQGISSRYISRNCRKIYGNC